MHKLRSGEIGPDQVSWKKRSIVYYAETDTSIDDSIIYKVKALDRDQKIELFSLTQVGLKNG